MIDLFFSLSIHLNPPRDGNVLYTLHFIFILLANFISKLSNYELALVINRTVTQQIHLVFEYHVSRKSLGVENVVIQDQGEFFENVTYYQ